MEPLFIHNDNRINIYRYIRVDMCSKIEENSVNQSTYVNHNTNKQNEGRTYKT